MEIYQQRLSISTRGKGFYEITQEAHKALSVSRISNGTFTVFCPHTSCSLVLMENADPSARRDLEYFMEKLVPESFPGFHHTMEGLDDMPSHIRMALTRSSETIPVQQGQLCLGTWQGIFLWEHRQHAHRRELMLTIMGLSA
jgi:secondary thiamine-phosphate synthase enzyme